MKAETLVWFFIALKSNRELFCRQDKSEWATVLEVGRGLPKGPQSAPRTASWSQNNAVLSTHTQNRWTHVSLMLSKIGKIQVTCSCIANTVVIVCCLNNLYLENAVSMCLSHDEHNLPPVSVFTKHDSAGMEIDARNASLLACQLLQKEYLIQTWARVLISLRIHQLLAPVGPPTQQKVCQILRCAAPGQQHVQLWASLQSRWLQRYRPAASHRSCHHTAQALLSLILKNTHGLLLGLQKKSYMKCRLCRR